MPMDTLENLVLDAEIPKVATAKLFNPLRNRWNQSTTQAIISSDGLHAKNPGGFYNRVNVFAEQGFEPCRSGHFHGTMLFYYEVTQTSSTGMYDVGLTAAESIVHGSATVGWSPHSYAIHSDSDFCLLSGKQHYFEWPNAATIKPRWKGFGDVIGCGLLLSPKDEMSIFFTLNGTLMGKQIPIEHPHLNGLILYPTVHIWDVSLEANFGQNEAGCPFKYDFEKCPGLWLIA